MTNEKVFNERLHSEAAPRKERIRRLREAGETWASIGVLLGISRQRAEYLGRGYKRAKGKR